MKKVEFAFAGLYDTVASYGLTVKTSSHEDYDNKLIDFKNAKSELKLDAINRVKQSSNPEINTVVQLAASEEHRENFSLTNINSAAKGLQIFLPGVHSDVGGSYNDNEEEDLVLRRFSKPPKIGKAIKRQDFFTEKAMLNRDKAQLVKEGWFSEEQCYIHENTNSIKLVAKRRVKSKAYSYIPLGLMVGYAEKTGIVVKDKLKIKYQVPSSLISVKNSIESYIETLVSQQRRSAIEDWQYYHESRNWQCALRKDYLHFSAQHSIGMKPRISGASKRVRKTYAG